jgi:hypothetical protein
MKVEITNRVDVLTRELGPGHVYRSGAVVE